MRTYTQEEKQPVIERVISGEPSAHILADTGIPKSTFYSWLRIYREEQNAYEIKKRSVKNMFLSITRMLLPIPRISSNLTCENILKTVGILRL